MDAVKTLQEKVLENAPEIQPGHWTLAALEEVCETAIRDNPNLLFDDLVTVARLGFLVALSVAQSVIDAAFQFGDRVTLNYRGQTFVLTRPSTSSSGQ